MITPELVLYVLTAIFASYIAVICYLIGRVWGKARLWILISLGFILIASLRFILLAYNLNNMTSNIITLTILLVAFCLIALGKTILYLNLTRKSK